MKLLSLFSGIGAFERALENLNMDYELVNYCEIDKYASKAYALLHCNGDESKNLWDINKVTGEGIEADIITYGFPCTDLSAAGKQKGFFDENGNKTRSGLVWDAMRVISNVRPKIALCENVKALTSKKFKEGFHAILKTLEEMGYSNYYQILNAKDYGVPQNRERIFIVSIRKDIDKKPFLFPQAIPLTKKLKDILLPNVDKKFDLSDKCLATIAHTHYVSKQRMIQKSDICSTLCARDYKDPKAVEIDDE